MLSSQLYRRLASYCRMYTSPPLHRRFFCSPPPSSLPPSAMGKSDAKSVAPPISKDDAYLQTTIPKCIALFESLQAQQRLERLSIAGETAKVKLPDGIEKEGKKWDTTQFDIAKEISKSLATNALISQVDGVLWDMSRPLEGNCELKLFTFANLVIPSLKATDI